MLDILSTEMAPPDEGRLVQMDADTYYADPCPEPSLSQSIAHVLLAKSPLHAWLQHPRLGGKARAATKAMDEGSLVHALLLGQDDQIVEVDADSWRTNAAKEQRDAARAEGKIPVLAGELDDVRTAVNAIRLQLDLLGMKLDGASELTALWTEYAEDGTPVRCRARLDHWIKSRGLIIDLKKSRSAHPKACVKHVEEYGYSIQHAAYTRAVVAAHPELAGRVEFRFAFFELEEPYCLTPAKLSGEFIELGQARWRRAVNIWAECLRNNKWPGYADHVVTLDPPPWAVAQEMEESCE